MRSSEDTARRPAAAARKRQVDLRLPLLRETAALPWRGDAETGAMLSLDAILAHAEHLAAAAPGAFLLGGGEPLLRPDLPALLDALRAMRPEGLGLVSGGGGVPAARLRAAGVERLHVPFHCARQDAHDWLVGRPGAAKAALRAIRAGLDADLAVTAEVVLTRPTMVHLAETIEVLARVGVRAICVRRLTAAEVDGARFVALSPRLALLESSLEQAAHAALARRVRLTLRDLPLCVAPRLRPLFAAPDSELWLVGDGVAPRAAATPGCATCPGWPRCAGAPTDYTARFGWEEFVDRAAAQARVHESVADQRAPAPAAPLVLGWNGPPRVACAACGDGSSGEEPTRAVRARLVQAARYRPALLRLVGADLLAHSQAARLVYDAVRLFPRVEVAGEASPLAEWSDLDLRRMKELQRLDVALYGPDAATHDAHCGVPGAFDAMLRAVERLRTRSRIAVGAYAVLHDAAQVAAYADAWQRHALPGTPRFRLSPQGG
ncbi:MAG: radical SAM protein, partial [Deltaproteobacteria bacterium]|nr:radical SAM protein [Deltaproteobacteria bacterium]